MRAVEEVPRFSQNDLLRWLRTILRFQIYHLRRASRELPAGDLVGTDCEPVVPPLEEENDYLHILRLAQEMPDLQRQIIEGKIERDESFKEIGTRLDRTEEATRKAFHRAIDTLRRLLLASTLLSSKASRQ